MITSSPSIPSPHINRPSTALNTTKLLHISCEDPTQPVQYYQLTLLYGCDERVLNSRTVLLQQINQRQYKWTVSKRYRDFHALRSLLSMRYPFYSLPSIPPKQYKLFKLPSIFCSQKRHSNQRDLKSSPALSSTSSSILAKSPAMSLSTSPFTFDTSGGVSNNGEQQQNQQSKMIDLSSNYTLESASNISADDSDMIGDAIVEERIIGFTSFMKWCLDNPVISRSREIDEFLEISKNINNPINCISPRWNATATINEDEVLQSLKTLSPSIKPMRYATTNPNTRQQKVEHENSDNDEIARTKTTVSGIDIDDDDGHTFSTSGLSLSMSSNDMSNQQQQHQTTVTSLSPISFNNNNNNSNNQGNRKPSSKGATLSTLVSSTPSSSDSDQEQDPIHNHQYQHQSRDLEKQELLLKPNQSNMEMGEANKMNRSPSPSNSGKNKRGNSIYSMILMFCISISIFIVLHPIFNSLLNEDSKDRVSFTEAASNPAVQESNSINGNKDQHLHGVESIVVKDRDGIDANKKQNSVDTAAGKQDEKIKCNKSSCSDLKANSKEDSPISSAQIVDSHNQKPISIDDKNDEGHIIVTNDTKGDKASMLMSDKNIDDNSKMERSELNLTHQNEKEENMKEFGEDTSTFSFVFEVIGTVCFGFIVYYSLFAAPNVMVDTRIDDTDEENKNSRSFPNELEKLNASSHSNLDNDPKEILLSDSSKSKNVYDKVLHEEEKNEELIINAHISKYPKSTIISHEKDTQMSSISRQGVPIIDPLDHQSIKDPAPVHPNHSQQQPNQEEKKPNTLSTVMMVTASTLFLIFYLRPDVVRRVARIVSSRS